MPEKRRGARSLATPGTMRERMLSRVLADGLVLIHLAFVTFVVLGGLLAFRWRWIPWVQVPCAAWGFLIEIYGWVCPLTPLENRLRQQSGTGGYEGGFVDHYLLPVLYPDWLHLPVQVVLASLVVVANALIYFLLWRRPWSRTGTSKIRRPDRAGKFD